jgi:hypothetical protein
MIGKTLYSPNLTISPIIQLLENPPWASLWASWAQPRRTGGADPLRHRHQPTPAATRRSTDPPNVLHRRRLAAKAVRCRPWRAKRGPVVPGRRPGLSLEDGNQATPGGQFFVSPGVSSWCRLTACGGAPARSEANRGTMKSSPRPESLRRQDALARSPGGNATLLPSTRLFILAAERGFSRGRALGSGGGAGAGEAAPKKKSADLGGSGRC